MKDLSLQIHLKDQDITKLQKKKSALLPISFFRMLTVVPSHYKVAQSCSKVVPSYHKVAQSRSKVVPSHHKVAQSCSKVVPSHHKVAQSRSKVVPSHHKVAQSCSKVVPSHHKVAQSALKLCLLLIIQNLISNLRQLHLTIHFFFSMFCACIVVGAIARLFPCFDIVI